MERLLVRGGTNGAPSIRKHKSGALYPLSAGYPRKAAILFGICYAVVVLHSIISFHSSLDTQYVAEADGLQPDDTQKGGKGERQEREGRKQLPDGFRFDRQRAEDVLSSLGPKAVRKKLAAYLEPPMKDEVSGTGNQGSSKKGSKDFGTPPDFVEPLPLRLVTPDSLTKFEYPKLQTCHNLQANLPVDRGLGFKNVGNDPLEEPMAEAPYCPVDADPFLPWLHDVFPSVDGTMVHFIAQNKRRCHTGKKFRKYLKRMEPQVSIMQPISVKRLDEQEARRLAPELWYPEDGNGTEWIPRYRLASFEDADADAQFTRFVCRFHTTDFSSASGPRNLILGETLSTYPFNYEFLNHRRVYPGMLTPRGKDNGQYWLSTFRFECPLPPSEKLRELVAKGESVLSDGTPTIHLDLVPMRTSPRFGEVHFSEGMTNSKPDRFDPNKRWGDSNVMPRVEASGRWENIPICWPPQPTMIDRENKVSTKLVEHGADLHPTNKEKPHTLVACTWASTTFSTRGSGSSISDGIPRLEEWIEYHLLVGFDHIYVYDNSGGHTSNVSLAETISKFSPKEVTRIDWPSRICNNNFVGSENIGERSSQYAAESSCQHRFGPYTEWMASFDTDEYLVPMGKYTNFKEVLRDAAKGGTQILGFKSTRAMPNMNVMEPFLEDKCAPKNSTQGLRPECLQKSKNVTFLETYNCDNIPIPKPKFADRAKKEIFRPSYVLHRHVHYSSVTKKTIETYKDAPAGTWKRKNHMNPTASRITDEKEEALMLHAKTKGPLETEIWYKRCHKDYDDPKRGCNVGNPWPNNTVREGAHDENDFVYNCFPIDRVNKLWIPRLKEAMEKRRTRQGHNHATSR